MKSVEVSKLQNVYVEVHSKTFVFSTNQWTRKWKQKKIMKLVSSHQIWIKITYIGRNHNKWRKTKKLPNSNVTFCQNAGWPHPNLMYLLLICMTIIYTKYWVGEPVKKILVDLHIRLYLFMLVCQWVSPTAISWTKRN